MWELGVRKVEAVQAQGAVRVLAERQGAAGRAIADSNVGTRLAIGLAELAAHADHTALVAAELLVAVLVELGRVAASLLVAIARLLAVVLAAGGAVGPWFRRAGEGQGAAKEQPRELAHG